MERDRHSLGLEHIADGRTAEIFTWEEGKVLKLFRPGFDDADYEAQMARAVVESGVSAPQIYETVEVEGRRGIVYERMDGDTLLSIIRDNPFTMRSLGRQFATVQAQIHDRTAPNLPPLTEKLRGRIQRAEHLTDALKSRMIAYIEGLPEGDSVCHGDFHPENILIKGDDVKVIDWVDTSQGNPYADVARTYILLTTTKIRGPFWSRVLIGALRQMFARAYLKQYFALRGGSFADVKAWLAPVAAGRLSEGITQPDALLKIVHEGLDHEAS